MTDHDDDTDEPAAVLARGLCVGYGGAPVLDGVDLTLRAGELRGLLGPNGAGKSTLLRILFGLVAAQSGSVEILGRRVERSGDAVLHGVAGFVEEPAFYPYLSGAANLELLEELDGGGEVGMPEALDRVGLAARADDRVGGWSTGMRQRLGIAAALVRQPRVLLLDEPTSGLDPAGIRAVGTLLRKLADDGAAVLVSSHLIGELEAICDSYTILRTGRVVWDGSSSRLAGETPGAVHALATSDDVAALEVATQCDVRAHRAVGAAGLRVIARPDEMDALVLALGHRGIAVRRLEVLASSLETMYFAMTGGAADAAGALDPPAEPFGPAVPAQAP